MDNLNDIISSLTPDDIEALKATAESIFGKENTNTANPAGKKQPSSGAAAGMDFGSMLSPEMIAKFAKIMSAMNSDGGSRCNLIEALKPNLSEGRQKKADEAMQLMKLMDIMPMLTNLTNRDD